MYDIYYNVTDEPFIDCSKPLSTDCDYVRIHSDVAYRIYLGKNVEEPCVVCVQGFDLKDYYDAWMRDYKGEIIQLFLCDYHAANPDSVYPDEEAESLVKKYLKEHMDEALKQFQRYRNIV